MTYDETQSTTKEQPPNSITNIHGDVAAAAEMDDNHIQKYVNMILQSQIKLWYINI